MRALKRGACLVLVLGATTVLWGGTADGATGDLSFVNCVANEGFAGCDDPPFNNDLDSVRAIQHVEAYGDDVYASSILSGSGSISWFDRQADGSLKIEGCISDNGSYGCDNSPIDNFNGTAGIAFSADGQSVYVAATGGGIEPGSVTSFDRAPDGSLSFQGCIADAAAYGCEAGDLESLDGAFDVAVAGDDVYVASTSGFVTVLGRNPDGSLDYEECLADAGLAGCSDPGGEASDPLLLPSAIASSPDGGNVYVTATNGSSLTAFSRDEETGSLSFLECHANGGGGGCQDPAKDALGAPGGVVVSPDGENVYVSVVTGDALVSFTRDPDGTIDFQDCIANAGENECVDPPNDAFHRAFGVAVDPAGDNVYVVSGPTVEDGALITLSRGAGGKPAFQGCIANDAAFGCADMPDDALDEAFAVAVSPDGQSVYAGAYFGNSVSAFDREAVPLAPLLTDTDPDSPADYNEPAIKGSAQAGATVRLYTNPTCTGSPAATGTAAQLGGSGIAVTVLDDSTSSFHATATDAEGPSPCSAGITYEESSVGPGLTAAPLLLATDPPSPADDNTPRLLGSAEAGTTINVYANPSCAGAPLTTAVAAELAPGIELSVADSTTTTFYANATGTLGTSACSAGLTYVELTPRSAVPSAQPPPLPAPSPAPSAGRAAALGKTVNLKRRLVKLRLRCSGVPGAVCAGQLTLWVRVGPQSSRAKTTKVIASRRFRLAAGSTRIVRIKLSRRGVRLVRAAGAKALKLKLVR